MLETINLDGGLTNAGQSLAPFGSLFTQSGILRPNAFTVSALSSPGMFVEVSGSNDDDLAILKTVDGATYFVRNTLPLQVPILTNSSGVTKTDAIVLMVDLTAGDDENAGSPGAAQVIAVRRDGTSTGLPTDGEIDAQTGNNPWIFLKQVEVTHNTGEIEEGDVTGTPDQAPLGLQIVAPGVIATALLAALAVTEAKIADGAVSNAKLKTGDGEPGGEWQNWTPTLSASGSMTYTSTIITVASYKVIGKTVFFRMAVNGTIGGTPSNYILFTLPIPMKAPVNNSFTGEAFDGDSSRHGVATIRSIDANTVQVGRTSISSNWSAGSNRAWRASGFYEID